MPNTGQGLGSFWDENFDGSYNPLDGDFPIIEIRKCEPENRSQALELLPDEMTFWIYNDAGGPHNESNGSSAIQMEIQVQAFAYATNDEINDMTFQRYKLINRASEDIRDTYFAMWVDVDLGCSEDDLIGCDVGRSLAYAYNLDAIDGDSGDDCSTGAPTYGENIPIVGTDYFRGPLGPITYLRDDTGNIIIDPETGDSLYNSTVAGGDIDTFLELGMSSFMYINRSNSGPTEPWTFDPNIAAEYYHYLRGFWRDGRALTAGGCGFTAGSLDSVRYAFPGLPSRDEEWSMCSECSTQGDRRTLQASGPFLLTPGAVNELIIGVVWVPDLDYPCPDIAKFAAADDLAQGLFDNCFNLLDGPDAPDVCAIELDKEVILVLTNDTIGVGNNKFEGYSEGDPLAPLGSDDQYVFEGYKIYQLVNAQVSPSEYDDIDKARLVQVVDIDNGVTELVNWNPEAIFGQQDEVWIPTTEVEASDSGVKHTFKIIEDAFADGDQTLINHKKYYFSVIAYAQNEWKRFDPTAIAGESTGQRRPYLEGRGNINVYTVIPRPIVYEALNSSYGDGVAITRLSGVGVGGNFVQLADGQEEAILNGTTKGILEYKQGAGPIEVNIYNPLEVKNGTYKVRITGEHNDGGSVCGLESGARWELVASDGSVIGSEKTIDALNEQIIPQYGFSISIAQSEDAGAATTEENGVIGASLNYADINGTQWYAGLTDGGFGSPFLDNAPFFRPTANFLRTSQGEIDNFLDPTSAYSEMGSGYWYPYYLTSAQNPDPTQTFQYYVSPAWKSQGFIRSQNGLNKLNNVDIVFTKDKSKWSRCIVVESNNQFFERNGLNPMGNAQTDMYDLRQAPSVNKEGQEDGEGMGMGWFPGYAIDVETGERLNVFFGENSYFNDDFAGGVVSTGDVANGDDMLFNPGDDVFVVDTAGTQTFFFQPESLYAGGHHMIFVTRSVYDECESLKDQITESSSTANLVGKINVFRSVTWTSIPLINADAMLSYEEGYIPNDLTVQLRVDNPYNLEEEFNLQVASSCSPVGSLPEYEFTIEGSEARELGQEEYAGALANLNVVPNPYYGYSAYETSQFTTTVKITNLPSKANITIYSLDGKFIKEFKRDEIDPFKGGSNPGIVQGQGIPDVEWDLKNFKGIPIASGIYLIHVVAPDLGEERTIKWFGVNRKFDPSGS